MSTEIERRTKFLPAFFVDPVYRGERYQPRELPLHMSLFPPIEVPYGQTYGDIMKTLLNPLPIVEIVVSGDDNFGDNNETPVKLVERSLALINVHKELVRVLGHLFHDPRYRQPYMPHVSIAANEQLKDGQHFTFGGFSIVEKIGSDPWIVRDKIGFDRPSHEV